MILRDLAASLILLGASLVGATDVRISYVEYMGQRIPLARTYRDFREYKDDSRNLTAEVLPTVERLIRASRFGPEFAGRGELAQSLSTLAFPGYGSFCANQIGAGIDPRLELVYVEIPLRKLNRYITLERQTSGRLRVVDDFVASDNPEITRVHRRGKALVYEASGANVVSPQRR